MSDTLGPLMERNLLEVFGQRDSARRAAAIAELYTADCTFFEAEEQVTGREALNAKVGSILKDAPGFVFRAVGPAQWKRIAGSRDYRELSSLSLSALPSRIPDGERSFDFIFRPGTRDHREGGIHRCFRNCAKRRRSSSLNLKHAGVREVARPCAKGFVQQ